MSTKNVYRLQVCGDDGYPFNDFSRGANGQFPWPDLYSKSDLESFDWLSVDLDVETAMVVDALRFDAHLLVSRRARLVIEELVPGDCLWYELRVNRTPFYLMSVERTIDCLDRAASQMRWFDQEKTRIRSAQKYVLKKEKIPSRVVFRIPENRVPYFASSEVRELIETAGLIGFEFVDYENPGPDDDLQ